MTQSDDEPPRDRDPIRLEYATPTPFARRIAPPPDIIARTFLRFCRTLGRIVGWIIRR